MKKHISILAGIAMLFIGFNASAQMDKPKEDKSKRPSPPANVSETINSGAVVTIDYSQPGIKGRTIGNEIAPYGKVWRTGANEATIFEVSKDVTINGKTLAAGKYGLYSIPGENEWAFIFNKIWDQWGTKYNEADDALRVSVKPMKSKEFTERMTFNITKKGIVELSWGAIKAGFSVK